MDFTSKDILYLVLAICAACFTAFACWALYYVIRLLRDVSNVAHDVREKIASADRIIHAMREKIESAFGSFGIAAAGFRMLGKYLEKRKAEAGDKVQQAADSLKKKAGKIKKKITEEFGDEEESEDIY